MPQDHWLPDFNFNVEEWFEIRYETLAICRSLELALTVREFWRAERGGCARATPADRRSAGDERLAGGFRSRT